MLLLAALAGAPVFGESVTFYFAPPANGAFQAKRLQISETHIGVVRDELTLAMLETLRVRQEAGSTYIASRVDQIAAAKEKKPIEMPAAIEAMKGSEIVRIFGLDGTLRRINGYDRMAAKALPAMTGETRKSFEKYMAEGRQDDRDRADWYEVEVLLGQTLELDRDYWFDAAWPDESGWILHQTLVRLGPWVDPSPGPPAHPSISPTSRMRRRRCPARVASCRRCPRASTPVEPGTVGPKLRIEGASTWLMDPATAVVWKIQSRRKVSEPLQINEELGVTLVTEEKIDLTLEPLAAPAATSNNNP